MRQFLEQPSISFVYNRYCADMKAEQEQVQREALERQQAQEREHASHSQELAHQSAQQSSAARGMRMGR